MKYMPLNSKIAADILHVIDGDLALNCGRIIQLYASWTCFVQYSLIFCSLSEVASDVISAGTTAEDVGLNAPVEFDCF